MIYSNKDLAQLIVEYCCEYEIGHVIISPGSRNAPLTINFTNHPKIKTYSIVDERCAAFFALGIAQQTQKPAVIVCTSGSALLNYYPAIAEAYYSDIPLVVISADRPKHLIDIGDGQTIRQENVFHNHSLYNANLSEKEVDREENSQMISTAISTAIIKNGPVHINAPFDEPLYNTTDQFVLKDYIVKNKIIESDAFNDNLKEYASIWNSSKKKLVIVGSYFPNINLQNLLSQIVEDESVLIFTETTSNIHHPKFVNSIDKLIFPLNKNDYKRLQPDILITLGGMVVSKKVKQFLRKYQPKHHWHIDNKNAFNTFHCLSKHFVTSPNQFLDKFLKIVKNKNSDYRDNWLEIKKLRGNHHRTFLEAAEFSDLTVFKILLENIPDHCKLQLGNSSVIRYSQLFDVNPTLDVFCNRGTSGIDGSTATAIGAAHIVEQQTVFITGDISFFYDSNALWNNFIRNDFRIIIINNGGGGIFKFIPGPSNTNVIDYFETPHNLTARQLSEMFNIKYHTAKNEIELKAELKSFYQLGKEPKLLEIFTPNTMNDKVLKRYFNCL
jgi:2-succinyl-5-enolpyruvyl-6-hydroxy-3-cyclohexene-1-carboxylate synthase